MKLSQASISLLENTIRHSLNKYINSSEQSFVTDIYLQANSESGELIIFDDEDEELSNIIIEEWVNYYGGDFYQCVEKSLSGLLNKMKSEGAFDKLNIFKSYSFVLADNDKETVAELLLIDDDTLLINDELLKGLDEELDAFLKDLLNS